MRTASRVARCPVAILVLLTLAAPAAGAAVAAGAGSRSRCAMCARQCCCAPRPERGGACRIEKPCGREESSDAAGPSILGQPALRAEVIEILPPENPGRRVWVQTARPLGDAPLPPERPPRVHL